MRAFFLIAILLGTPAFAEIEEARDLMEAGRFSEAREALWPAARSGNADAEELIGVMYALGLGVEQDYTRAFEWYLRSAMKGHPGAQSGVGWYYEVGLGMPAPDLVRAWNSPDSGSRSGWRRSPVRTQPCPSRSSCCCWWRKDRGVNRGVPASSEQFRCWRCSRSWSPPSPSALTS